MLLAFTHFSLTIKHIQAARAFQRQAAVALEHGNIELGITGNARLSVTRCTSIHALYAVFR